jgi:4-hydroxy-tetrahydrodipicolinate reductase
MELPRLALVGYGRMGREIESLARRRGFAVTAIFSRSRPLTSVQELTEADVVVDFSVAEAVPHTAQLALQAGKRLVIGTTGWEAYREELRRQTDAWGGGVVYASNFAIGVQLLYHLVQQAARFSARMPDYDIFLHEIHHRHKRDAPSGTARKLAELILRELPRKRTASTATEGPLPEDVLHVSASRGGEVIGTHTVYIDAPGESVELIHRAKSRESFAAGALLAAQWIASRQGFYEFSDVLQALLG